MKKYIFIFVLFCGIFYTNVSGKEATWWYVDNMNLGVFSKVEMTDENHMQFEISFADSDFTIKRRSNDVKYDEIIFKKTYPYDYYPNDWMVNLTMPDIPTSGFHVLLPGDREVDTVEYDTVGTHLFVTDFVPTKSNALTYSPGYSEYFTKVLEDRGYCWFAPLRFEQFVYRPCVYDSISKNLWMMEKMVIKITLKPTERLKGSHIFTYREICNMRLRPVINSEDGEKFYPEEFVGIKSMEREDASCIRAEGKNEIGGNVNENIRDAYVEIRNDLGMRMEKIKVPERGKFTLNLESRNWPSGLYLCTLVADGARVGTTKIMIKP
jgi:hypothetical protein